MKSVIGEQLIVEFHRIQNNIGVKPLRLFRLELNLINLQAFAENTFDDLTSVLKADKRKIEELKIAFDKKMNQDFAGVEKLLKYDLVVRKILDKTNCQMKKFIDLFFSLLHKGNAEKALKVLKQFQHKARKDERISEGLKKYVEQMKTEVENQLSQGDTVFYTIML